MQDQSFEIRQLSQSYALYLSVSYESPLCFFSDIEAILREDGFSGKVLFDQLLCNGDTENRFVEFTFDKGEFDYQSYEIIAVESLDDSILCMSKEFYIANRAFE